MRQEQEIIENRLKGLAERMKEFGYHEHWARLTVEYVNRLQEKGVLGVDRLVQRLERCTKSSDSREYWEVLMEGRLAVTLANNKFSGIEVEYCDKGPDVKSTWNRNIVYFEVTRKRSLEDEWAEQLEDPKLPSNKTGNLIGKIKSKLKQLEDGGINIVFLCSSTMAVDEHNVREAFKLIEKYPREYEKLSGILFTNDWGINVSKMKQFYLFNNENASKPIGARLTKKLNSLLEQNRKKLQRKMEELAVALRQLKSNGNQFSKLDI